MKAKEYQISLIQLIMNLKMSEGGYCGVKINTNNESFPEEYRVKCESSSSFFVRACKLSEEKDGKDYKDNPVLNRKVKDIQTKIAHWDMHNEVVLKDKYSKLNYIRKLDKKYFNMAAYAVKLLENNDL